MIKKNKGFSLIEMMVTVSIMVILMTAAVGSMNYYYRNQTESRITSLQKVFDYAIIMARSEGRNVIICPISADSVDISGTGVVDTPSCNETTQWGDVGIIAFLADDASATSAVSGDDVITSLAGGGASFVSTAERFVIRSNGFFTTSAGAIAGCRNSEFVAGLNTNLVGRVIYTENAADISVSCS